MQTKVPSFTFGIEEEYHLVNRETRQLASAPPELLRALRIALPEQVAIELMRSQIEVGTKPSTSFAQVRQDLRNLRQTVIEIAAAFGLAPMAASTHPFGGYRSQETTHNERYAALATDLAGIGRRLVVCGMHVHVGIEDPEMRIDIMNQARYFLPHLLTLSTSSPFWEGDNTGLKSFRLAILSGMPRSGLPDRLRGWDDYRQITNTLINARVIDSPSKIWWDLRPSEKFPTLEMRITDVCPCIEDAISIASLFVSLCRMLYRLRLNNQTWRDYPTMLVHENRWRAQRYGVSGTLFDFGVSKLV
ncbi:MAG: carboxylate-amine ligase, partial [Hyphomicrobiaceae bacterium]